MNERKKNSQRQISDLAVQQNRPSTVWPNSNGFGYSMFAVNIHSMASVSIPNAAIKVENFFSI
jgi:hypothetical protein